MHRCNNSHGNSVSPCPCGWFPAATSNSFSMLFSMPNHQPYLIDHDHQVDDVSSSLSPSSVDCTLSLGTPSTRQIHDKSSSIVNHNRSSRSGSCVSNLCWDIFQSDNKKPSTFKRGSSTSSSSILNNNNNNNNLSSGDPLLARRCANCDTTSTPLWRNGPRGPKSLCNACGIRYKKEERRASSNGGTAAAAAQQHYSWASTAHGAQTTQRVASIGNEFRFIEEDDRSSEAGIPNFLSWRLNVPDRHSGLVHDYT